MNFLFPFFNFFQPGVFWPSLADYRPMQIIAVLALLMTLGRKADINRLDALKHPAIGWMVLFLMVQALSVYRGGVGVMAEEFGYWSVFALFVFVSIRIVTEETALRRYLWGMIFGSMWIVVYGMVAVGLGLNGANGNRAGAYGMYENHNDYTFIIVQTLPFVYLYWRDQQSRLLRWLLGASTLLCVLGVFMSLSRGGMFALVLEVALIAAFTLKPRVRLFVLPLLLVIGAGAVSYQYVARSENQDNDYTAEDAETSRFELWRAGAAMIEANPLLGVGSRTFGEYDTVYAEISHDNLGKNAHNTLIDIAATSGLIGLAAFLMMLRATIRELRRPVSAPISPWLRTTRLAALVAVYTLCFRALLDVKSWDWSFYLLVTVAAITGALVRSAERSVELAAAPDESESLQAEIGIEAPEWSNRLPG